MSLRRFLIRVLREVAISTLLKATKLDGLPEQVVPIAPISRSLMIQKDGQQLKITRFQLPMTPAYGFTDFRSQGQTINPLVFTSFGSSDLVRTATRTITMTINNWGGPVWLQSVMVWFGLLVFFHRTGPSSTIYISSCQPLVLKTRKFRIWGIWIFVRLSGCLNFE